MKPDPEHRMTLSTQRTHVLELVHRVERAQTRDDLTQSLSELHAALQDHFASERAAGLRDPNGRGDSDQREIQSALNLELADLRAEIDGTWREHQATREALVRRIRRHEAIVARATGA
jgi:hypothetical protein